MLAIADMVSFAFWRFLQPLSVLTDVECTVQRALAGKCLINLLLAVVHHGPLLCSPLYFLFFFTRRCVYCLMVVSWMRGKGVDAVPFMTCCYLISRWGPQWLWREEDRCCFWPWPGPWYLASFLLWKKFIILFRLGPASNTVLGRGVGGPTSKTLRCNQNTLGRELSPSAILILL